MKKIDELKQLLKSSSVQDVWYDVDLPKVGELLNHLNEKEWETIIAESECLPVSSQRKLSQASIYTENKNALRLLLKLLHSTDTEVGTLVAESLIEKNYKWDPEESIVEDLKRHIKQASEEQKKVLERLLGRLPC
ncbi:hypothetical protein [Limnoraphis robusta]|uniref:HEAT repeat domain-containing protein n=1 Tax=Limnoraphis robusta CCNP1315 TaxID=3110306 RepID=A0ABU5TYU4_9CYAN|nr:hypothetical protein [Limnoraphis robusta]MEA5519970.1 hypothetical protein [Limnoraphis robusta CCNP1315]MEA5544924.1 hypothetical protein [Limnoraphis robusta CCNP1324]